MTVSTDGGHGVAYLNEQILFAPFELAKVEDECFEMGNSWRDFYEVPENTELYLLDKTHTYAEVFEYELLKYDWGAQKWDELESGGAYYESADYDSVKVDYEAAKSGLLKRGLVAN